MPRSKQVSSTVTAESQQDAVSEGIENYELPRSLVTKLARSGMSENMKMQKEVVLSLQKSSTVFINYLAATAHEVASSKQHKSISASDVLKALELLEMGDMVPMLQKELQVYRECQKSDKGRKSTSSAKGRGREQGESASASASTSISLKVKLKGKEKEKGPTITISRSQIRGPSVAAAAQPEAEVEPGLGRQGEGTEQVDEDEEMAEADDVEEEDDDLEPGEEDEPEDTMAVEETRKGKGTNRSDDD
ncbi:histone-fold-containing protein [Laetiporus sulphureus 93-53]|uniref:DNA polymerase epsilon subunit D n=1 Tax=Laetiporus sulphureus 93-53 TaxID=1314785 RepID=A0A165C087_9APHY|nr:histone-fold-containing protein [Laetiporus sulphureus 93-53]KZT01966.1 histone-fold-containing protein [Laetiporus sulphureus 93-53]